MSDNIIAIIGIHKDLDSVKDNLSQLTSLHIDHQMAERIATAAITSKGGKIVGEVRGNLVIELPMDDAEILRQIQEDISEKCHINPTIGVGTDMTEAQMSFKYAEENTPGHIKVYDHEVMQFSDEQREPDYVTVNPQDNIRKAENNDDEFTPISPEEKLKVKLALEMIKKNKPLFDQMKAQAPDVYVGVVGIINSLQLIMQEEKIRKEQKLAEVLQNLANAMQQKRDEKNNQDRTDIISNLDIDNQLNEENQLEDFHDRRNQERNSNKKSRAKAKKFASKVGHSNPEFFHQLAKVFKVQ